MKGKRVIVRETAAECEILLNLLPLLIGSKIPDNNKYWLVLLDFIRVVRWLSVWSISKDRLAEVQYLTEEWLETFHAVFPTTPITPNFHYLFHCIAEIEKHGFPTYYKTLRFESKHQSLKKFALQSKNRINISKTIVTKHQRALCIGLKSQSFFAPDPTFVVADTVHPYGPTGI